VDTSFHLKFVKTALVVGAGHGIGLEIARHILNKSDANVHCLYSNESRAEELFRLQSEYKDRIFSHQVNWLHEETLKEVFSTFKDQNQKFDLVLNAVGVLYNERLEPEKSLRQVSMEGLTESFQVNSFLTPLVAKYLRPCLDRKKIVFFAALSAMVGSIEDNSSGGWYSYRASKTALNMFVKNISLEFKRSFPASIVLAIHPGTTNTRLSNPFSKNVKHQIWTSEQTAQHLFEVFESKNVEHTGRFYNWDGTLIPW